jgi:hypothetical protein
MGSPLAIDRLAGVDAGRGPDVRQHRRRWRNYQGLIDPKCLVFINAAGWTAAP